MNLSKNVEISEVGAPITAANNTDSNSDILDMAGWEGVCFVCAVTDSTANGVISLVAEANTANSDSGMAVVSGGTATATSAVNDDLNNKLLVLDVYRPTKRYVQCVRITATQNGAFSSLVAIKYGPREKPTAEASTINDMTLVVGG